MSEANNLWTGVSEAKLHSDLIERHLMSGHCAHFVRLCHTRLSLRSSLVFIFN